jgi:dihydroorotase-like cyclic amidohydrolase
MTWGELRVAAYGGTTTLLHFAYARTGDSLYQRVEEMLKDATARSRLDFGLHGGMFEAPRQVPEIPRVMELGVRTFKFFLTYLKQGWYTDDYQLIKAMDILAQRGGMQSSTAKTAARLITWRTSTSKAQTHRPNSSTPHVRRRWRKKASFARSDWPRL